MQTTATLAAASDNLYENARSHALVGEVVTQGSSDADRNRKQPVYLRQRHGPEVQHVDPGRPQVRDQGSPTAAGRASQCDLPRRSSTLAAADCVH